MIRRAHWAALVLVPAAVSSLAGAASTASPVPLSRGTWLDVSGNFDGAALMAEEVETTEDRSPSLKGPMDSFTAASGELGFGPLRLMLDENTRLEADGGGTFSMAELRPGRRVKLGLADDGDGRLRVRRLRLLAGEGGDRHLEGPVQAVSSGGAGDLRFHVLGVEVVARPQTRWAGVAVPGGLAPSLESLDDEDERPAAGFSLGAAGRLSGEVRFDYISEENFDLVDELPRDLDTRRLRAELELTAPARGRFSGMAQIKAESESEVRDQVGDFQGESDITLGRTYLFISGVFGSRGSLQIGRSRFDDDRDWLFNRDLDAVRFFLDTGRWHLETSLSEQLIDPEKEQKDIRNSLIQMTYFPGGGHTISAYYLRRRDRFREADGQQRGFSPSYLGLRAQRLHQGLWGYWLEAALARGNDEGEPLRGRALDVGVIMSLPAPWAPTLTAGFALGSGDDDPQDGVNRTFRQSGLQLNNTKWNGVTNFRYYGELLRPELANLRIQTLGMGWRPRRQTSIDLIFHRYRLDRPSSSLVRAAIDDRRLDFSNMNVGREWDVVVGFEELEHLEFELDLGYFEPGPAFLGPQDAAMMIRLKAKFVF